EELDIDAVGIEIEAACRRFGERHRGRIGFLGPEELAGALEELAWIRGALVRLTGTVRLRVALNVDGAAERAAGTKADAIAAGAEEMLRFFELEWLALPDARVEELCASPALGHVRHMLRSIRQSRPARRARPRERASGRGRRHDDGHAGRPRRPRRPLVRAEGEALRSPAPRDLRRARAARRVRGDPVRRGTVDDRERVRRALAR